jgi:hypothetical protein
LADDIHAEDGLGDTFMLDFGGMFKATIDDGTETFRLENEVLETGGVDTNVVTPNVRVCKKREKIKLLNDVIAIPPRIDDLGEGGLGDWIYVV